MFGSTHGDAGKPEDLFVELGMLGLQVSGGFFPEGDEPASEGGGGYGGEGEEEGVEKVG